MSPVLALPVPDIFVRDRATVGEGPVVDGRNGELAWVDIPAGELRRIPLDAPGTPRTACTGVLPSDPSAANRRCAGRRFGRPAGWESPRSWVATGRRRSG